MRPFSHTLLDPYTSYLPILFLTGFAILLSSEKMFMTLGLFALCKRRRKSVATTATEARFVSKVVAYVCRSDNRELPSGLTRTSELLMNTGISKLQCTHPMWRQVEVSRCRLRYPVVVIDPTLRDLPRRCDGPVCRQWPARRAAMCSVSKPSP